MVTVRPYRKRGKRGLEVDISHHGERTFRRRLKVPDDYAHSLKLAKRWGEQREWELAQDLKRRTSTDIPTLADFESRYVEGHCKANRQKASSIYAVQSIFKAHLLPALGDKRLDLIDAEDVQQLKAQMQAKTAKTVNNVLTILSSVLKQAQKWGVIEHALNVELLRAPRPEMAFYDFDELEALIDAAAMHDLRALAMVLLGARAGLRAGEMAALEWSDVNRRRGELVVRQKLWRQKLEAPKWNKVRRIPMTAQLADALKDIRHMKGPRVLYQDNGRPVTYKVLTAWMRTAQRLAGIKVTGNLHILRHTFCSHLAMRGVLPKAIKEYAGHATTATTDRYTHLSPDVHRQAIQVLDEPAPGAAERMVQEKK